MVGRGACVLRAGPREIATDQAEVIADADPELFQEAHEAREVPGRGLFVALLAKRPHGLRLVVLGKQHVPHLRLCAFRYGLITKPSGIDSIASSTALAAGMVAALALILSTA